MLKIGLFFKKNTDLRINHWRILTIKIAKLSGYYFYMNLKMWRDFQICISVPLRKAFAFIVIIISQQSARELRQGVIH